MRFTDVMIMDTKLVHLRNAPSQIIVTDVGLAIEEKLVILDQFRKAHAQ